MDLETISYIDCHIRNLEPLGKKKNFDLICEFQKNNNIEAGQKIVMHHVKYMMTFIPYYMKRYKVTFEDLFTIGIFALYTALKKFNLSSGSCFSTVATYWIVRDFNRFIIKNRLVRIPEHKLKKGGYENFKYFSIDADDIRRSKVKSNAKHKDCLLIKNIGAILDALTEREREIIKLYFGVGRKEHNLEEIGNKFALSRERIRQIKKEILDKLRDNKDMIKINSEL